MKHKWAEGDQAMIVPNMTPCVVQTVCELLILVRLGTKEFPSLKSMVVSPIQLISIHTDP
jgi:hypothetical protein